jgi:hypothetical protein
MFAAFAASKIKANEAAKYAKGGWTGKGSMIDSTGERMAGVVHEDEFVIRKGPAHKYRDVLDAINRDDRRMIFNRFNKILPGSAVNNIVVENEGPNRRLDQVNANLRQLNRKQGKEEIIELAGATIIHKGTSTRIIKR